MKSLKNYLTPELNVLTLSAEDVITASTATEYAAEWDTVWNGWDGINN